MATGFGQTNRFDSISSIATMLSFLAAVIPVWTIEQDGDIKTDGNLILNGEIRADYGGTGPQQGVAIYIDTLNATNEEGGAMSFGANNSAGAGFRYVRVPNA